MQDKATLERYAADYEPGAVLFREGDDGRQMYVIQRGTVEIRRTIAEREHVLAVLPPGEFFGEMAILNKQPRSASAVVATPARLLVIDASTFESMLREKTDIAARMIQTMSIRLARANQQVELLLLPDASHRVVQLLRQLAEEERTSPIGAVHIDRTVTQIAQRAALSESEVERILKRLSEAHLVMRAADTSGYIVPEVGRLLEFLEFLELRERQNQQKSRR